MEYPYGILKRQWGFSLIYNAARDFSEGLAPTLKDGKWGFIKINGETANGYFVVELDGKKLLINKKEEIITSLKYEDRIVMKQIGN